MININEWTYIIWTDGTTTYAVNGITGNIDYNGTDSAAVIQNAINSSTNGGKIFIKAGKYSITTSITIGSNINMIIEGEGYPTILSQDANVDVIVLGEHGEYYNNTIKNLKIISKMGAGVTKDGIRIYASTNNLIENVQIYRTYNGIYMYGDGSPKYCYFNVIFRCKIDSCYNKGIFMDGSAGYDNDAMILNCDVTRCVSDNVFMTRSSAMIGGEASYSSAGYGIAFSSDMSYSANFLRTYAEGNSLGNVQGTDIAGAVNAYIGQGVNLFFADPRYASANELNLNYSGYYKTLFINQNIMPQMTDSIQLGSPNIAGAARFWKSAYINNIIGTGDLGTESQLWNNLFVKNVKSNTLTGKIASNSGTAANRPTSGSNVGEFYFSTDISVLSCWTGSVWMDVKLN